MTFPYRPLHSQAFKSFICTLLLAGGCSAAPRDEDKVSANLQQTTELSGNLSSTARMAFVYDPGDDDLCEGDDSPTPEPTLSGELTGGSFLDLDGDGRKDNAAIVRQSGAIPNAITPDGDPREASGEPADRVVITFGDGKVAAMVFPFVERVYAVHKGGNFPNEVFDCLPAGVNQAVYAVAEEGGLVLYHNENTLFVRPCVC